MQGSDISSLASAAESSFVLPYVGSLASSDERVVDTSCSRRVLPRESPIGYGRFGLPARSLGSHFIPDYEERPYWFKRLRGTYAYLTSSIKSKSSRYAPKFQFVSETSHPTAPSQHIPAAPHLPPNTLNARLRTLSASSASSAFPLPCLTSLLQIPAAF
jgi:hypothetical protein